MLPNRIAQLDAPSATFLPAPRARGGARIETSVDDSSSYPVNLLAKPQKELGAGLIPPRSHTVGLWLKAEQGRGLISMARRKAEGQPCVAGWFGQPGGDTSPKHLDHSHKICPIHKNHRVPERGGPGSTPIWWRPKGDPARPCCHPKEHPGVPRVTPSTHASCPQIIWGRHKPFPGPLLLIP